MIARMLGDVLLKASRLLGDAANAALAAADRGNGAENATILTRLAELEKKVELSLVEVRVLGVLNPPLYKEGEFTYMVTRREANRLGIEPSETRYTKPE